MECNYISLPEISISGDKVLIYTISYLTRISIVLEHFATALAAAFPVEKFYHGWRRTAHRWTEARRREWLMGGKVPVTILHRRGCLLVETAKDMMITSGYGNALHYWPFVTGIHRYAVDSRRKGPVMQGVDVYFIVTTGSKKSICLWYDLRRQIHHCDVT